MSKFVRTTAINRIKKLHKRIKGVQGGTSAGKTYGILPIEIDYAIKNPGTSISVVAESVPHLKRGAIKDFKEIMFNTNRWPFGKWNATDSRYTFNNNSYIEFFSADDGAKLRGGRRDRLYMNEANNMSFDAFTELAVRTKGSVVLDWNPTSPFWFHTELQNDPDVDFIILTYKDNEACPQSAIDFILKAKEKAKKSSWWDNWHNVYGLGQIGSLEGVIFGNWSQLNFIPQEAKLYSRGLDFGYTNDPTTVVDIYKYNDQLILDERLYRTGMVNADIINWFKSNASDHIYTIADSAEPKSIEEIRRGGVKIKAANKGKDSIMHGIQLLQQYELLVTSNSTNLIKELRNYTWDKDKAGNTINKPIDAYNHCFSSETIILTTDGGVPISNIKVGDYIINSSGQRKVLKVFNNGKKQIYNFSMQFDTFCVSLRCTKDHKIKTSKGWIEISKLQEGSTIYLTKSLRESDIIYTAEKGIFQKVLRGCIELYGNTIKERSGGGITSTILMVTQQIMKYIIYRWLKGLCTIGMKARKDLKRISSGFKTFAQRVLNLRKNGTDQKKVSSGTESMVKTHGETESTRHTFVNSAEMNINQGTVELQNTVITTAKLRHLGQEEGPIETVYDLMIDEVHEYIANGIVVHNCVDAVRYGCESLLKPKFFAVGA